MIFKAAETLMLKVQRDRRNASGYYKRKTDAQMYVVRTYSCFFSSKAAGCNPNQQGWAGDALEAAVPIAHLAGPA